MGVDPIQARAGLPMKRRKTLVAATSVAPGRKLRRVEEWRQRIVFRPIRQDEKEPRRD